MVAVALRHAGHQGDHPIKQKPQGEQTGGDRVRVDEEAVSGRLVDELLDEDDEGGDAGDEADGAKDDVECGQVHGQRGCGSKKSAT